MEVERTIIPEFLLAPKSSRLYLLERYKLAGTELPRSERKQRKSHDRVEEGGESASMRWQKFLTGGRGVRMRRRREFCDEERVL